MFTVDMVATIFPHKKLTCASLYNESVTFFSVVHYTTEIYVLVANAPNDAWKLTN